MHPEEVLDPRSCGRKTGRLLVFDEIVSQEAAEPVDISSVQKAVEASRRSRVVHRVSSSWGCLEGSLLSPEAAVHPVVIMFQFLPACDLGFGFVDAETTEVGMGVALR